MTPTRDEAFYIEGGDIVFLTSATLFRVHKFLIGKDDSAFGDMFEIGKASHGEGQSDDQPILLEGVSAVQFKDLLWCLYALPHQIWEAATGVNPVPVERATNIAKLAHMFRFEHIQRWAVEVITRHIDQLPEKNKHNILRVDMLESITEVSLLTGDKRLERALDPVWEGLIATKDPAQLAAAINFCERQGSSINRIKGMAYATLASLPRERWTFVNRDQHIRLLVGHYAISREMPSVYRTAPTILQRCSGSCAPPSVGTTSDWYGLWARAAPFAAFQATSDVVGLGMGIKNWVQKNLYNGRPVFCTSCHPLIVRAVDAKVREVEESLADHFVDI